MSLLKLFLLRIIPIGFLSYYRSLRSHTRHTRYKSIKYCDGILNLKTNSHVAQVFQRHGCYEASIQTLIKSCIHQGTNVLDIGANVGIHSIFMAQYVDTGKVYAFEPVKHLRSELKLNVKLSGHSSEKIIILPHAVGDSNVTKTMFVVKESEFDQGSSSIVENEYLSTSQMRSKTERRDVEVVQLDDFVKQNSINNISFIKIDIEGYEFEALTGMQDLLKNEKPTIVLEYNIDRIRHRGLENEDLSSVLTGYLCFEIVRDSLVNNRDLYALEPFFFDRDIKCDLVCFPA